MDQPLPEKRRHRIGPRLWAKDLKGFLARLASRSGKVLKWGITAKAQNLTNTNLEIANLLSFRLGWEQILLDPLDRVAVSHAPLRMLSPGC